MTVSNYGLRFAVVIATGSFCTFSVISFVMRQQYYVANSAAREVSLADGRQRNTAWSDYDQSITVVIPRNEYMTKMEESKARNYFHGRRRVYSSRQQER